MTNNGQHCRDAWRQKSFMHHEKEIMLQHESVQLWRTCTYETYLLFCKWSDKVIFSVIQTASVRSSVVGRSENRKFSYKPTTEFQIWPLIYPECEPVQRNLNKTTKQLQTTNTVWLTRDCLWFNIWATMKGDGDVLGYKNNPNILKVSSGLNMIFSFGMSNFTALKVMQD